MKGYIQEAAREGRIGGLETALDLANLQRESGGDLDYFIATLKEILRKENDEIQG